MEGGGYESGECSRRRKFREYDESDEIRHRRDAEELFEKTMEELERQERAERTFNEVMRELRRAEAEQTFNEVMDELRSEEEAEEAVKQALDDLERYERAKAEEKQENTAMGEFPREWDPTIDDWGEFERAVSRAFEGTGITEEEMKERWRESYVNEMEDLLENEEEFEKLSSDSVKGEESIELGESRTDAGESDEHGESGDGTVTSVIAKQPSEEIESVNVTENKSPETGSEQVESEHPTSESKVNEVEHEESETVERKEEPIEYDSEEKTGKKPKVRKLEGESNKFIEKNESQVESAEKKPARKTSGKEAHEEGLEYISSDREEDERTSGLKGEFREVSQSIEDGDKNSEITTEIETSEDHLVDELEEEEIEEEEGQESSYKQESNQDSTKDTLSDASESDAMEEEYIESSHEIKSEQKVESTYEDIIEELTYEDVIDEEIEEQNSNLSDEIYYEPERHEKHSIIDNQNEIDKQIDENEADYETEEPNASKFETSEEVLDREKSDYESESKEFDSETVESDEIETHEPSNDEIVDESTENLESERLASESYDTESEEEQNCEFSENEESSNEIEEEENYWPPMFPKNSEVWPGMFPETPEEREKRLLEELFGKLPEEVKEYYKELALLDLLTEDDLRELLDHYPELKEETDFEESLEEAMEYLKPKQKVRELEDEGLDADEIADQMGMDPAKVKDLLDNKHLPTLIWKIRTLETERIWSEHIRRLYESDASDTQEDDTSTNETAEEENLEKSAHRGKARKIKIIKPKIRGKEIKSEKEFRELIRKEFPGFEEREDSESLIDVVINHIKLRGALGKRKKIKQYEVEEIAKKLGIKRSAAIDYTFYGNTPLCFKILEKTLSKSEAKKIVDEFRKKLGRIKSWDDVRQRLDTMYPNKEYEQGEKFKLRKQRVFDFFVFLDELEKGGSQKGIARRTGISKRVIRSFMDKMIPYLIRHVEPTLQPKKKEQSLLYKVILSQPKVRGKEIRSIKTLKKIIKKLFPGFADREDLPELLRAAKAHLSVIRRYRNKEYFAPREVFELEEDYGFSHETIKAWLCDGVTPMIYEMLARALTRDEAEEKLKEILSKLNSVTSFQEMNCRLRSLYVFEELKKLVSYKRDRILAKKFFRFLKALPKGGLLSDIARRAGLQEKEIRSRFFSGILPNLVIYASNIPAKIPKRGKRWLPLKVTKRGRLKRFLQVPLRIRSEQDLRNVLKQLPPLRNNKMKEYEKEFGRIPKDIAFMYLLGIIVSDGGFGRKEGLSTRVNLTASKVYNWSKNFGRAFCYSLGKIGIAAERKKDQITEQENGNIIEMMYWESISSPLIHWIRHVALGLTGKKPKSKIPLNADWILKTPSHWRKAFLQGISDGDGWASVRSFQAGIATSTNHTFFLKLLKSLGIKSSKQKSGLLIYTVGAIREASQLPLFKHASGRQGRLEELKSMYEAMKWNPVSNAELSTILDLHKKGYNYSEIASTLWAEYEIARRPTTIKGIIKRNKSI
jgi:hypothetical protein